MTPTPTPKSDWTDRSLELAHLLAQAGLGDRAAFSTLYQRTSAHLLGVISRINRDRGQAEDVLQEVYVNVWRAASSFDAAQSQPLTWLTSVARNRAIDSLRRARSQPAVGGGVGVHCGPDDVDFDPVAAAVDDSPGPLDLLDRAGDARVLARCIGELSAPQRQCIALAFYDGLSHTEVALNLRQPLGTVKSWLRRALLTLRACVDAVDVAPVRTAAASGTSGAGSGRG